jgi:hypothetical protein
MNTPDDSLQARFAAALLDPERAPPPEIASWNGSDPGQRFAVYRNNVTVSLIEALGAGYPAVRAMVGEDFFAGMAREFLHQSPPRSPVLAHYGQKSSGIMGFPEFIAAFEPAATLPYLADLARLEGARRTAYHARDAASLGPEAFAALDEAALVEAVITLHPSACVLASPYAIASLHAAHLGALAWEDVNPEVPEDVLVVRPAYAVDLHRLCPGGAAFLGAVQAGKPLGDAALAGGAIPGFCLPEALHLLITSGAAISIS